MLKIVSVLFFKSNLRRNVIELFIFAPRLIFNDTSMLKNYHFDKVVNCKIHVCTEKQ